MAIYSDLPNELRIHIFSFLPELIDQINLASICKSWKSLLSTPQLQSTRYDKSGLHVLLADTDQSVKLWLKIKDGKIHEIFLRIKDWHRRTHQAIEISNSDFLDEPALCKISVDDPTVFMFLGQDAPDAAVKRQLHALHHIESRFVYYRDEIVMETEHYLSKTTTVRQVLDKTAKLMAERLEGELEIAGGLEIVYEQRSSYPIAVFYNPENLKSMYPMISLDASIAVSEYDEDD